MTTLPADKQVAPMQSVDAFEFPPEQHAALRKARRLAWWTLAYLALLVVLLYFVMGSSQAMRVTWIEDMLSMIPPVVFLVASYTAGWQPNRRHPYGYHRGVSVAFLIAAATLCAIGGLLFVESVYKLVTAEHPTIGSVNLFGHVVWLGWLMYPVLVWKVVPAMLLGRAKVPLAEKIHDKVLYTDAHMNRADWKTGLTAMIGVTGIGLGWWWADAAAAILISLDILQDGIGNLREVGRRLIDEYPRTVERQLDPLPERVRRRLSIEPWVADAAVRLREQGHVLYGEAFVVPKTGEIDVETLETTARHLYELDWRLHEIVLVPVAEIAEFPQEEDQGPSG